MRPVGWQDKRETKGAAASRRRRVSPSAVAVTLVGLAIVGAACGGASGTAGTVGTTASEFALIQPPKLDLDGCQYLVNNVVPPGEPKASKAPFASFSPDQSAIDALQHMKAHGATGMVDGFTVPAGTVLFSGPSATAAHAGVVQPSNSILIADPILWTDGAGKDWLAFFVICGGNNLYWLSVDQVNHQNPTVGRLLTRSIAQLRAAQPYTKTGMISVLPVVIDGNHRFAWVAPDIQFQPARSQYLDA